MISSNGLFFYPHGVVYSGFCIQCSMGIVHFPCYPIDTADAAAVKTLLKTMAEKMEQQHSNNANNQQGWSSFQPSFGSRPEQHPFNYEEQHRDRPQGEFNDNASNQQTAPFMQHFFPRIGLPFGDFTDYNRFNGFQRNAFFPNPFAPQFPNPAYSFPINPAMHNQMSGMDGFNLSHGQHQVNQNGTASKPKEGVAPQPGQNAEEEKPPVLSVEYCIKPHEAEQKFNTVQDYSMSSKKEATDESADGKMKKDSSFSSFPPTLSAEKPFEQARLREDILTFNPPFYPPQLEMGTNNSSFKQEMTTPPVINGHVDLRKKESSAKREGFQPPPGTLHDCQVCLSTHANGLHFGARTCAACAAFFRRTISDDKRYVCKRNQRCTNASRDGTGYRKICRSCRMKRCLEIGMLPENVQHKRNRRESGSPNNQKIPFDNFFTGFYQPIPPNGPIPISMHASQQPTDLCHNVNPP